MKLGLEGEDHVKSCRDTFSKKPREQGLCLSYQRKKPDSEKERRWMENLGVLHGRTRCRSKGEFHGQKRWPTFSEGKPTANDREEKMRRSMKGGGGGLMGTHLPRCSLARETPFREGDRTGLESLSLYCRGRTKAVKGLAVFRGSGPPEGTKTLLQPRQFNRVGTSGELPRLRETLPTFRGGGGTVRGGQVRR